MRIKTHHNATPSKGQTVQGVSQTIPNETFTIPELMRRFTNGMNDNVADNSAQFSEEATHNSYDLEKVHRMDTFERQQITQEHNEYLNDLTKEVSKGVPAPRETSVSTPEGETAQAVKSVADA